MSTIFSSLGSGLLTLAKTVVSNRAIRKEDIEKVIKANIDYHDSLTKTLEAFTDKDMKAWFSDIQLKLRKMPDKDAQVVNTFIAKLNGKARSHEQSRPLKSLAEANDEFRKVLKNIIDQMDKLFEEKHITLYNVRLSQTAVFGVIRQSDVLVNFTTFLYTYLTRLDKVGDLPKYRRVYLLEHVEQVANIVSNICSHEGPYDFIKDVDAMRRQNADLVLGATGTFDFAATAVIHQYSQSFLDNILTFLSHLNIFKYAFEAWDDYCIAKYERNKEISEWLKAHQALLRMKLSNMDDKTSPEYTRLENIITAYDAKIADYDSEILAFEQED